jgi:mono/diheme cytochrome c family protein
LVALAVALAKAGEISGPLVEAAISASPWGDVRQAAAEVLPLPKARGGASLPPVAELVKRKGDAKAGRAVFAGTGTCGKCHVVNGEGKSVGPDLSGIGAKLSPLALYESILAPSAAISHNYETWTVVTDDGRDRGAGTPADLADARRPGDGAQRAGTRRPRRLARHAQGQAIAPPVEVATGILSVEAGSPKWRRASCPSKSALPSGDGHLVRRSRIPQVATGILPVEVGSSKWRRASCPSKSALPSGDGHLARRSRPGMGRGFRGQDGRGHFC